MNKQRRLQLTELIDTIDSVKEQIESLMDEEQDYYDNMPDSFRDGEKGDISQTAIDSMQGAIDDMDNAMSNITEACS